MTIKLRYKHPGNSKAKMLEHIVNTEPHIDVSSSFAGTACVAAFGMTLRESPYVGDMDHRKIVSLAQKARGDHGEGCRSEFINIVKTYGALAGAADETVGMSTQRFGKNGLFPPVGFPAPKDSSKTASRA